MNDEIFFEGLQLREESDDRTKVTYASVHAVAFDQFRFGWPASGFTLLNDFFREMHKESMAYVSLTHFFEVYGEPTVMDDVEFHKKFGDDAIMTVNIGGTTKVVRRK